MHIKRTVGALAVALLLTLVASPAAQADEVRDKQWYLDTLHIDKAHQLSQGAGVTIGVIDLGIDPSHPDLKGVIKEGQAFGAAKSSVKDPDNHGTGIASILAGQGHGPGGRDGILGIAPKAKIVSVGIAWTHETRGEVGTYIGEAISYLVDEQHVNIITTSLEADGPDIAETAIKHASEQGVVFVAAAGNSHRLADGSRDTGEPTGFPAALQNAIAVLGSTESGQAWEGSVKSTVVDNALSAPGANIIVASAGGGYETHDGTSISAPIVAGTYALVKARYPDLSWEDLANQVLLHVTDAGKKGKDPKFGFGIVNPVRALTDKIPGHQPVALKDQGKTLKPGAQPSVTATPDQKHPDWENPDPDGPRQSVASSADSTDQSSSGPSIALVVTIAAALALIGGAGVLIRRRRVNGE